MFDSWDPANVSPLVAYLATEDCPATGQVFFVQGGQIRLFQPWTMTDTIDKDEPVDGGRAAGGDAPARRLSGCPGSGGPAAPRVTGPSQPDEVRSRPRPCSSGTGAGAEGGIVVPWPVLFRHRMHHRLARSDRYQWWVLWTVLAGLLSVNITFTVFVVALPQVAHQLHTSVSTLTWTSTGPLLAFGVAAPVLGKLGDLRGYRRLYLWGLSGAAVSVVLTASAPTAGVLIAARLFDGVQGAATGAASMALVLQAFSHEDRVKAMGWWALVGRGGSGARGDHRCPDHPVLRVAGPVLGRAAPDGRGRRAGRDRAARPRPAAGPAGDADRRAAGRPMPWRCPGEVRPAGRHAPARGANSTGRARGPWPSRSPPVCWPSTRPRRGASPPRPPWPCSPSACWPAVVFVLHERRAPRPLIPLRYFRMRNFVFPLGARTFVNFSYMGGFFLFPILMERVYGYSETRAGLVSTARPLMFSLVGARWPATPPSRWGSGCRSVAGRVVLTVSMVVFTQLGASPSLVVILVALALSGVGIGLATPSTAASASNEVAPDELGVMSAAQQLITQIGIVAGIQVMVTVQASGTGGVGSLASFHRAYAVGAVVAVAGRGVRVLRARTPRAGAHAAPRSGGPAG